MSGLKGTIPPMDRGGGEQKAPPKPKRRIKPPPKPPRRGTPIGAPTNAQRRANAGKATPVKPAWNHSKRGWSVGRDIAANIERAGGAPNTATATKSRGELSQAEADKRRSQITADARLRKAYMWQKEAALRKDWNTVKLWNVWGEGETKGNAPHILEKKWKYSLTSI